jgi:hypothetical protein
MYIPHFSRVANKLPYDEVKESSGAANGTNMYKAAADTARRGWYGQMWQRDTQGGTITDAEIRSGEAALAQTRADDALLESKPRYHALFR